MQFELLRTIVFIRRLVSAPLGSSLVLALMHMIYGVTIRETNYTSCLQDRCELVFRRGIKGPNSTWQALRRE